MAVAAADDLGYPTWKDEQLKVVTAFMQGPDVFAVLLTGYGKSLCFGCLPLAFDKLSAERSQPSIVIRGCHSLDSHYERPGMFKVNLNLFMALARRSAN